MEHEDWITSLPEEVLVKIFKFTSVQSRSEIVLVCSKFYKSICYLERDKFPLELEGYQVNRDENEKVSN